MHRMSLAFMFALLVVTPGPADPPVKSTDPAPLPTPKTADPKPLDEVWEGAYVQDKAGVDVKIGHIHMTSVPVTVDGVKLIRTTKELRLAVARSGAPAELKADISTDEDAAGKVRVIRAKIWLAQDRVQTITCTIKDTTISVDIGAGPNEFRWDPANVGLAREQTLLHEK